MAAPNDRLEMTAICGPTTVVGDGSGAPAATIGHLCKHLKHFPKSQSDDDQLDIVYASRYRIIPFVSHLYGGRYAEPNPHATVLRVLFAVSLLGADDDNSNEFTPCARFPLQSYGVDEDVFVNFMGWSGFTWSAPQRAALRFLVGLPVDGDRRPFSETDFASAFGLDDDKNSDPMDPLPWESLRGVLGAAFNFRCYVPSEIGDHADRLFKVDLFKHKTFKFKAADRTLVSLVEFSAGRIAGVESR
ncbi:hypothetical protein DFJ73DRAFT_872203 [Zopfochytrium polystomum]|nr:hypothetical protein DFJ73DRAFT_872203 [Zopfochytrium polystomum]